jgi:hypothetical protein
LDAVGASLLLMKRAGWDATGMPRSVMTAILAADQCNRALEHKHPRVEIMRMCCLVHVRLHRAFANLIALQTKISFELFSGHRVLLPL